MAEYKTCIWIQSKECTQNYNLKLQIYNTVNFKSSEEETTYLNKSFTLPKTRFFTNDAIIEFLSYNNN